MQEKKPFVTKELVEEIVKTYPTPFHIYDETGIRENARRVNEAFAWNKGFKEYFAVKATPNPFILNILKEENVGVDCATQQELMLAEACGFSGENIMFSSNDTPNGEFSRCKRLGGFINLDDVTMVDFLDRECGVPEAVFCRFNPGGVYAVSNGVMDNPGDAKFGMTEDQLCESFIRLHKLGAKKFGIHSFLVSGSVTNDYYPMLASDLFKLAVRVKEKTGISVSYINLSGGIGVAYRPEQTPCDIKIIGERIRGYFEEIMVPAGLADVSIFTELGRFMLAPYGHLVSKAIHEKHIYKEYIGLDACCANLMRPAMYGAYHHITVLGKEDAPETEKYDVTGCLCENNDKFAIDRMLPKIEMGDYVVIHDTGAHGFSMGYNYNGVLRSSELLKCADGSVKLIRRAEEPKDYFATFDFCDIMKNVL